MHDIKGTLVTIDAMACQTKLAKAILDQWWRLRTCRKEQAAMAVREH